MFIVPENKAAVKPESKYGRLRVCGSSFYFRVGKALHQHTVCECDCGKFKMVAAWNLRNGVTKSCGCLHNELAAIQMKDIKTDHGLSESRLYRIWRGMKQRCFNGNNKSYERYGARGVSVWQAWWSFRPFMEWALANGYRDDLTLERIDNDGSYSPANCKWATVQSQSNNRRSSKMITAFGETKSQAQWLLDSRCRVSESMFRRRMKLGWSTEAAITNDQSFAEMATLIHGAKR